jgi:hypothetical protein
MQPPFTTEQFFEVFRRYNEALWPAQLGLIAVAFVAIALAIAGNPRASRFVSVILAALWLWMAVAYLPFAASIMSRGAIVLGALFVVQAVLFGAYGVWKRWLEFRPRADLAGVTGLLLLAYALAGYPLLGAAFGQRYPAAPTFGLPCPTAIFTLALLLWARPSMPRALLAVPLLWAVVATVAALTLGVWEDLGLTVAAVLVAVLLLIPRAERRREAREETAGIVAGVPG